MTLWFCLGKLGLGMIEMFVFHRKHLVLSPEEIFIQTNLGKKIEGIDSSRVSNDAVRSQHRSLNLVLHANIQ
jgi:hypothetical protein